MIGTLTLDRNGQAAIQVRLRRVEGQIAGLQRMLAAGRDCAEIAQQVAAARAALDRVAIDLLAAGLDRCLQLEAAGGGDGAPERAKLLKTLLMLR